MEGVEFTKVRWNVPESGFRWVDAPDSEGREGRHLAVVDPSGGYRRSFPMEDSPGLFRIFANLSYRESAVLKFANQHGTMLSLYESDPERGDLRMIEPCSSKDWFRAIRRMRELIELSTAAAARDEPALEKLLTTRRPMVGGPVDTEGAWTFRHADDKSAEPREQSSAAPDLVLVAQVTITAMVNDCLDGLTTAVLTHHLDTERFQLRITARNLMGTLWLQFAKSIEGQTSLRECPQCGKSYLISHDARSRENRRFCSDRCRYAAHQARRRKAIQMTVKGKKPWEIAKDLGTEVKTIRKWLAHEKERKPRRATRRSRAK